MEAEEIKYPVFCPDDENDKQVLLIPKSLFNYINTLKNQVEDFGGSVSEPIPIPNFKTSDVIRMLDFLAYYDSIPVAQRRVENKKLDYLPYEKEYVEKNFTDEETVHSGVLLGNYLECTPYFDINCRFIALLIRYFTPEQIREKYNIEDDLTQEEKEAIIKKNKWIED